ncbi:ion channel [Telmatospirillum sp. J64-1]|uniref:ion channel n=1 Tax=Telmatospirillum sp. J64-1 TaxID=2502183 RepID=UPI00115EE765|nr:ion channel [Telmatospirillum sp. J64-1]
MRSRFLRRLRGRDYREFVRTRSPGPTLIRFTGYLTSVIILHSLAIAWTEGLPIGDALWLTLTTVTTVGYGDYSAETALGRIATALMIYLGGIFVLFQAASIYFDYRAYRRQRMILGSWRWNMADHILILNAPVQNPEQYMIRLVCEFRNTRRFRDKPVQVVSSLFPNGLPEKLRDLGVVHYHGNAIDPDVLVAADAAEAAVVVVLAVDDQDKASDGRTFDILDRLQELGTEGRILAECVEDTNRPRLRRAGADIIVRPLRGYPEMIVRALVAPGAEAIIEDLFTSRRDECWRYDVRFGGLPWTEVVTRLVKADIGVPLAYRCATDGSVKVNPPSAELIEADKLYVIVREGNSRRDAEVARLLGGVVNAGSPPAGPPRPEERPHSAG